MRPITPFVLSALTLVIHAEETPTAANFAKDGKLSATSTRLLIADREKIGINQLVDPGSLTISTTKLENLTDFFYGDIANKIHLRRAKLPPGQLSTQRATPPFTIAEVDAVYPVTPKKEKESWEEIQGVTAPYKPKIWNDNNRSATFGPLKLRKELAEIDKGLTDSKGAKISYADNHQSGENGAWNSQGVLYYPLTAEIPFPKSGSVFFKAGLAGAWNIAEREAPKQKITDPIDAEELTLSAPLSFYINPPGSSGSPFDSNGELVEPEGDGPGFSRWIVQTNPYLNTDFSFDHEIYGATATVSYVGNVFGSKVVMGTYQNLCKTGWAQDVNLRYQLTLSPMLDYSDVKQTGEHTTRAIDDDWFRLGAKAGIDVAFGPTSKPFTFGTSYQFFDTVDGDGGYSYLWKSNVTWWVAENVGLSFEHQTGTTPIADKDVDQTTFGLEFRY